MSSECLLHMTAAGQMRGGEGAAGSQGRSNEGIAKEMYDDEQELQKVKKDLAAERNKTFTYGWALEMRLKTSELVDSSGEFSRSPSLTPPPETPRLDASVGRPAVPDEMDIAESSTARN